MNESKEIVEAEPVTGSAIVKAAPVAREDFQGYAGVATVELLPDKARALTIAFPDEAYDILPTGEVYVSQVHYRRRLNEVFGPGSWALVPRGPFALHGTTVTREYALVGPGGRFISEAIGEAEYQPSNDRMSYASACEAAKSNALTRCCKDLGVASECWDRRFCDKYKAANCVSVWRKNARQRRPEWRRKDAKPFHDETGPAEGAAPTAQPTQPAGSTDAPASAAACKHCGSQNVTPDPAAPEWLMCADCNKGTKR